MFQLRAPLASREEICVKQELKGGLGDAPCAFGLVSLTCVRLVGALSSIDAGAARNHKRGSASFESTSRRPSGNSLMSSASPACSTSFTPFARALS